MTFTTRGRVATAGVFSASLLLGLAACGSSSGSNSGTSSPPSSPPATSSAAGVHTVMDSKLGTIVEDGQGFTLYRFDVDTAKPPASHCTGQCATAWPPEPATGTHTVKGVDLKLIGSVTRADGSKQLTLDGWPLYRYAADAKPGDTNGQAVGGTWWAVTPTGAKAMAGTTGSDSPSSGSNGY